MAMAQAAKLTRRAGLAGIILALQVLGAAVNAQTLDCVFPHNAADKGWMPSSLRLARDPETGRGEVLDRITEKFAGGAVPLRTTRADGPLLGVSWTLKVVDDTHKMATLLYRLTWNDGAQRAQLVMLALGYSNIYTAQGTCTAVPGGLRASAIQMATD